VLALCVSAYTAHVQRQQRHSAGLVPIPEYGTSNGPTLHLTLANKGVGPARIRHVVVSVDGEPFPRWQDVLRKLLGHPTHGYMQSTVKNRVLSVGESVDIMAPLDAGRAQRKRATGKRRGPARQQARTDGGRDLLPLDAGQLLDGALGRRPGELDGRDPPLPVAIGADVPRVGIVCPQRAGSRSGVMSRASAIAPQESWKIKNTRS
jgi:hypothetical protein